MVGRARSSRPPAPPTRRHPRTTQIPQVETHRWNAVTTRLTTDAADVVSRRPAAAPDGWAVASSRVTTRQEYPRWSSAVDTALIESACRNRRNQRTIRRGVARRVRAEYRADTPTAATHSHAVRISGRNAGSRPESLSSVTPAASRPPRSATQNASPATTIRMPPTSPLARRLQRRSRYLRRGLERVVASIGPPLPPQG
jgi:hypothetical protein